MEILNEEIDFSGKYTMVDMYKKAWTIASDVGGSRKFIIVFENNQLHLKIKYILFC